MPGMRDLKRPLVLQTYHFNFHITDGKPAATAIVESGQEQRDVEFVDVKCAGDTISFVELRRIQDREIRIEFSGELTGDAIKLVRKAGNFGSTEGTATRQLSGTPAEAEPAAEARAGRRREDRSRTEGCVPGFFPHRHGGRRAAGTTPNRN